MNLIFSYITVTLLFFIVNVTSYVDEDSPEFSVDRQELFRNNQESLGSGVEENTTDIGQVADQAWFLERFATLIVLIIMVLCVVIIMLCCVRANFLSDEETKGLHSLHEENEREEGAIYFDAGPDRWRNQLGRVNETAM